LRRLLSLQQNRRPTWRISASLGPKVAGVSEVWMTGTIRAGQPHLDRDDLGGAGARISPYGRRSGHTPDRRGEGSRTAAGRSGR
jgi:hypothetical protein